MLVEASLSHAPSWDQRPSSQRQIEERSAIGPGRRGRSWAASAAGVAALTLTVALNSAHEPLTVQMRAVT